MTLGLINAAVGMLLVVVASNLLVEIPINSWLTYGAFSYPISFLITEVTTFKYGANWAKRVVFLGFLSGLITSWILVPPKIAFASSMAFLVGQLLDISLFSYLRGKSWWIAPLIASVLASLIDTSIFFGIAFFGTGWLMYTLALGDFLVKLTMDLLLLLPFRMIFIKANIKMPRIA
jgi:uncharacterized PurR-regulated membrane protein YhhQ (DUF165 family)